MLTAGIESPILEKLRAGSIQGALPEVQAHVSKAFIDRIGEGRPVESGRALMILALMPACSQEDDEVHDMLVAEKVDILFHGHDHFYAKQELDGIVYQECPQPIKSMKYCYRDIGQYENGELRPNAGYLSVSVNPISVKGEYIRTFISKKGMNGKRDHTYILERSGFRKRQ